MGFSRQEYCSRLPFPSPGDLPDPVIEPTSPAWQACSLPPARWRQTDPVSRRRSEWEGRGVTSREGSFLGEGPACVMTWRCETAPLFQLICIQFHHLRVGSRKKKKKCRHFLLPVCARRHSRWASSCPSKGQKWSSAQWEISR